MGKYKIEDFKIDFIKDEETKEIRIIIELDEKTFNEMTESDTWELTDQLNIKYKYIAWLGSNTQIIFKKVKNNNYQIEDFEIEINEDFENNEIDFIIGIPDEIFKNMEEIDFINLYKQVNKKYKHMENITFNNTSINTYFKGLKNNE